MSQGQNSIIGVVSNLKINSDTIVLDPQSRTGEIVLSNLHQKYFLHFKIKTNTAKILDVKPTLGCIKPGEQQKISFKPSKGKENEQITTYQQTLQFLLQAVNRLKPQITKQQEQALWQEIKTKKANVQLGYCSVKLGVSFSASKQKQKQLIPFFSKVEMKPQSRYLSQASKLNKDSTSSNFPGTISKMSNSSQQNQLTDAQLSRKYEKLKEDEQRLLKKRKKIFQVQPKVKKASGPSPLKRKFKLIQL